MELKMTTKDAYDLVHNGVLAFARMERQGIRIDVEYCEKKKEHLTRKIKHLQNKLEETELVRTLRKTYGKDANIGSNDQLAYILYTKMGIRAPKTTKTGKGSTDEDTLSK